MRRQTRAGAVLAAVLIGTVGASACSSSTTASPSTATAPPPTTSPPPAKAPPAAAGSVTTACRLTPTEDLIERDITPRIPPSAILIGNVNLVLCKPTVDTIQQTTPSGPGYCTQIARSADNPGYNPDATPAAPLRKIIAQYGSAC